jgi:hypothetical protein
MRKLFKSELCKSLFLFEKLIKSLKMNIQMWPLSLFGSDMAG